MPIHLLLNWTPRPQKRPRLSRHGTYDPSKKDKQLLRLLIIKQIKHLDVDPLSWCAHSLRVHFTMPIPKSWSKKNKACPPLCTKRPDLDNLLKLFLDAGNELLWQDDSSIIEIHCKKTYGPVGQIDLFLEEVQFIE